MKHILVVIDPTSKRQPALERAAWYAKQSGATLELFICDYEQHLAGERFFDSASLEQGRRSMLEQHAATLRSYAADMHKQGLAVEVDARWDHPLHEGIARKARDAEADLVVKDTHFHATLRRSIFSNTDWNLIRACPVPLWLVKPRDIAEQVRIVAAVDPLHERDKPAELDHRILDTAKAVRRAVDGELHVFHAFDVAPALAVPADALTTPLSLPVREIADGLKARHGEAVHALCDEHGLDRANVHLHEGATRELLITLTEQLDADLVVMGAVSRTGVRRLFLGSTAEQLLDRLPCDVLIVKPAEAAVAAREDI